MDVGSEERFAEAFGAEQVWAGTTTSPVTVPQAGQVQVARAGGAICLAPMTKVNDAGAQMAERVREAFWSMRVYPDARALKWSKLLLNMLGNASSAILGMPPGEIYAQPALYQLESRAIARGDPGHAGITHPASEPAALSGCHIGKSRALAAICHPATNFTQAVGAGQGQQMAIVLL